MADVLAQHETPGRPDSKQPPAMVPGTRTTQRFVKAWNAWQNYASDFLYREQIPSIGETIQSP